ncbi:MAG: hypothetical protein WCS87_16640 [Methylococcaceae bacterium]
MKALLHKNVGQELGINCKEVAKFHAATLVSVLDNYFTIEVPGPRLVRFHYPYSQIIFVSECADGFQTTGFFSSKKVNIIVQVQPLTTGGNGSGVGVGVGIVF